MAITTVPFTETSYSVTAGFTDRLGGSSAPPYDSFNLGLFTGDPSVEDNYRKFYRETGLPSGSGCWTRQVHGDKILKTEKRGCAGEADGLFTTESNLTLIVQTADCIPLLYAHNNIPFIGSVHVGWRGLQKNIVHRFAETATVSGLNMRDFSVAIGPHLQNCHFVVTAEFKNYFPAQYFNGKNGNLHFDPTAVLIDQLLTSGIKKENILHFYKCTHCNEEFYSYRRDKKTGREIGFITIS